MKYQGDWILRLSLQTPRVISSAEGVMQKHDQRLDVLPLLLSQLRGNVLAWFVLSAFKFKIQKQKTNQAL